MGIFDLIGDSSGDSSSDPLRSGAIDYGKQKKTEVMIIDITLVMIALQPKNKEIKEREITKVMNEFQPSLIPT